MRLSKEKNVYIDFLLPGPPHILYGLYSADCSWTMTDQWRHLWRGSFGFCILTLSITASSFTLIPYLGFVHKFTDKVKASFLRSADFSLFYFGETPALPVALDQVVC